MIETFRLLSMIEQAKGTNEKMLYLEQGLKENLNFEKFIRLAEEQIKYGVSDRSFENAFMYNKEMKTYFDVGELACRFASDSNKQYFFEDVKVFTNTIENLSGLAQIEALKKITMFDKQFAKWVARVLVADLKIGIQLKSINKVLKKMKKMPIERFQVQLCGSFKNIYEAFESIPLGVCGIKEDGIRADVLKVGNEVTITSRSGKNIEYTPELKEHLINNFDGDIHFDSEIMAIDFSTLQKRIGKKTEFSEVDGLKFRVFDVFSFNGVDYKDKIQKERYELLQTLEEDEMFTVEKSIVYSTFKEL